MARRLLVTLIAAALVAGGTGVAYAGDPNTMNLSPQTGQPGTVVTLSQDTKCTTKGDTQVEATMHRMPGGAQEGAVKIVQADNQGDWQITFTIPANAAANEVFEFRATCYPSQVNNRSVQAKGRNPIFTYNPRQFTTAQQATTTTTSTTVAPTTTTAPAPTTTVTPAAVAAAVAVQPTFAG